MSKEIIQKAIDYLNNEGNPKWVTSSTLINKLDLRGLGTSELDDILFSYFKENENAEIRHSTLPSVKTLDVLWGSMKRIKNRAVQGINRLDEQILIEELERVEGKNMFLSHSFKDSKACIEFAKLAVDWEISCWLAEAEILRYGHINESVKNAIQSLPFFSVFITDHLFDSVWSAKEIEFALSNKKEIIGIIYTKNQRFLDTESDIPLRGNYNSREILKRFFDNHPRVKFIKFPDSTKNLPAHMFDSSSVVDLNYLKSSLLNA